jgi:hypothetical protein
MRKAIILVVQFVCLAAYAQKVDLDKFYFTASYRDLPRTPLDTSYHTFQVWVTTGPLTKVVIKPSDLEQRVGMDGWRRLQNNAHLEVQFHFDDVIIENTGVKENVEVLKDKNGKETGTKSTYVMQVTYTYGSQASLVDYKGQSISSFTLASRDEKRVFNSESFSTSAEANAYLRFGLVAITNQLIKQCTNEAVNSLNATLTLNYGYPDRTTNDFFWILNSRKHPEYASYQRAWINFKQAITNMSPDQPLDQVKADLQPVIDYLNSIKKKYNSDSKTDKKMRYASYYNLAKIYWYLDNPDAAMKEANELVINGFDPKDGERLEAGAENLKQQLRSAKRDSRHFRLNIDEYQGIGYGGQ